MTNRELLELAALAADYLSVGLFWDERLGYMWDGEGFSWDPINDDSDAFALAAKVRLRVDFYDDQVEVKDGCDLYMIGSEEFENTFVCIEPVKDHYDMTAAARLAIVRAAAKIGEFIKHKEEIDD